MSSDLSRLKAKNNSNSDDHASSDLEVDDVDHMDDIDADDNNVATPASPGMEHLLREQMEANKRLPKNVKYNKAFDIAKLCAEYLKDTPNQLFEIYLQSFKGFATLLRDGMSLAIVDFLENPAKYELCERAPQGEPNPSNTNISNSPPPTNLSNSPPPRNLSNTPQTNLMSPRNLLQSLNGRDATYNTQKSSSCIVNVGGHKPDDPNHIKEVPDNLKDAMQLECLVKEVP